MPAGKKAIIAYQFFYGALVICFEFKYRRPRNTARIPFLLAGWLMMLQMLAVPAAKTVEVLSIRELAFHCVLPGSGSDGVDGQYLNQHYRCEL